jgi:hypothetical protein
MMAIQEGVSMIQKASPRTIFLSAVALLFFAVSCSSIPLIGKKKDKEGDKSTAGKTVTVEGMEGIKGVNPPQPEAAPAPSKASPPPTVLKKEGEIRSPSVPARPLSGSSFPLFQMGLKKKIVVLDFENKTTYQEEKMGEAVQKRLIDKLEATQRAVTMDRAVVAEMLKKEGFKLESLSDPAAMKRAHHSLGIQAFVFGTVTDVSILSSKTSEASEEEIAFATSKVEVRLVDASTGNLLKTFIGRSPIFGTKEAGEYSRSKAALKAIDFSLDDCLDSFLRQLDYLDWTTTIAKVDGDQIYFNAGKLSGLRIGDTLEIYEPGKEIIHPQTQFSLGWTTGQLKGAAKISNLFGVDAAIGKVLTGNGFDPSDVVKSTIK